MISPDHLRRLTLLKLSAEAFAEVLAILAEIQGADDARRERERVRRAQYPRHPKDRHKDKTVTVTGPSQGPSQDRPLSDSLKKERKIPEAIEASGPAEPTQADLEKALYARGRQVLGKSSGGMITSLMKAKGHDVALARSLVEVASTKHDPREYIAAAIRSKTNDPRSAIAAADRLIEGFGGMEAAKSYVPGSSGPTPLRLDFGEGAPSPKLISSR